MQTRVENKNNIYKHIIYSPTYCFNSLAIHFIMLFSFSEVQASITLLVDQKIWKVHLP